MGKARVPVVAVFDVGKTNKKLFLFDEKYRIVFERSARFLETADEDGDPCENLQSLRLSVFDSLHEIFRRAEYDIRAINFTSYGASFVYLDEDGRPLTPLYNYLKPYPAELEQALHEAYGGKDAFALSTASPSLGSLNSGLQVYRLQREQPDLFNRVRHALHLPQYLSFLVSGQPYAELTSIGCHTALWDYRRQRYHQWVGDTGIEDKLAPVVHSNVVFPAAFPGSTCKVGVGLHDSSCALIPYRLNFDEPFILISTGTWCVSFNPFNTTPLTRSELDADCLFYMDHSGQPVKASRLFAGYEHDVQTKRIAAHFGITTARFRTISTDWKIINRHYRSCAAADLHSFGRLDLSRFETYVEAYHVLMLHLVSAQLTALRRVFCADRATKRIFVDGGFSRNLLYMELLAKALPDMEVYAAAIPQATAVGAALVIHQHWNRLPMPGDIIKLQYFRS